jgi:competence ComEA-like helix-hairpin-helix protein
VSRIGREVGMKKGKTGRISSRFIGMAILGMVAMTALFLNSTMVNGKPKAKALLDLNTASQKQLERLKGVDPATAKKIIAGRPYHSVDELSKAGIPAKTIKALKPFVTVGPTAKPFAFSETTVKFASPPPTVTPEKATQEAKAAAAEKAKPTVGKSQAGLEKGKSAVKLGPGQKINLNSATQEEIAALPGIDPAKARAIIEGRPYRKIEDLTKVKGIKSETFSKIKDYITVK